MTSVTYTDWKVTTSSLLLSNSPFCNTLSVANYLPKISFADALATYVVLISAYNEEMG